LLHTTKSAFTCGLKWFREDGVIAFTAEHIFLHVDTNTGKSSPMGSEMMTKLKPIGDAHAKLPQPVGIGRRVGEKPAK